MRKPGRRREATSMIANMPTSTFLLYIGAFVVQFVFVIGYGIWWCLQDRDGSGKGRRD